MQNSLDSLATPTLKRRLICMLYEAFLLLAVEMLAVGVYMLLTQNRHSPTIDHGRQAFLFLVAAAYFIHSWTDSGHTLAMKTWRIKLIAPGQTRLPIKVAALRYLLAWGWFVPAMIAWRVLGLSTKSELGAAFGIGLLVWALTALFDKDRQFLHDRIAGTRLVQLPKPARAAQSRAGQGDPSQSRPN